MATLYFLSANQALTKAFYPDGSKESYPLVSTFTSHSETITTLREFQRMLEFHAKQGHCLLKGELKTPLNNESRRGATATDDATSWICLDFDRHECADLDDELTRFGLGDVGYVLQYSASHGTEGTEGTQSAHIFMLLSAPMPAPRLKSWLMALNLDHLRSSIRLSRTKTVLSWPLDITTCQNDKLLYISPPEFHKPLVDPLKKRIHLVEKKYACIDITRIGERHINVLKEDARKVLNQLRVAEGLPKRTAKTSWIGAVEVENKPDESSVTGIKEQGEFIRLNLNGGDSWAYWHPKENFELIYDFKSDCAYRAKELVPGYYQSCVEARQVLNATPTANGDLILAFRDLKTAEYYNGLWNPENQRLDLYRARNETQLEHWMRSHGRSLGDFIPIWNICYEPREFWIVDEENHRINLFRQTQYMRLAPDPRLKPAAFPNILYVIQHMLGEEGEDTTLSEAFLNWFAVIFQRKDKPITAWVLHGVQGTGKGYFYKNILKPLLGEDAVMEIGVGNIEDSFNGWLEGKLFINVNEVDVDDFREKGRVEAKLKTLITDSTFPIRRMRQTATNEPNWASFMFCSNKRKPVFIPTDDRRYNVANYQKGKLVPPKEDAVSAELEAFAQWLLAHKADIQAANRIVHTEAREMIQKLGVTSVQETCQAILTGDFDKLWLAMPDERLLNESGINNYNTDLAQAYILLMKRIAHDALKGGTSSVSRDEMGLILQYNVGGIKTEPNRLTSLLRHNGIDTKQIRHNGVKTYGIQVQWTIGKELREEVVEIISPKLKLRRAK